MTQEIVMSYDTKRYGWLELTLDTSGLVTAARFVEQPSSRQAAPQPLTRALDAYFQNGTPIPDSLYQFPTTGTDWQHAVWRAIMAVPAGKTITYTELAAAAGKPAAARSAGTACGKNPLALFIPCHRVVRSNGEDFGYSWGPERKRALLCHEGAL